MSKYRDEQLAQLEVVRRHREQAVARFFDATLPEATRLESAPSTGTFAGDDEIARAIALFRDGTASPLLRAAALNGLSTRLLRDDALLREILGVLEDTSAPSQLRHAALFAMQSLHFGSSVLAAVRPRYKNALRGLLDDADALLRQFAAEYLALDKDEYVQRRLLDGLREPGRAIVAPELAIQYLANDLHSDVVPLLREIAMRPPSAAAKKEALRNLAIDPESKALLAERVRDDAEDPEIRHVCAVALFQLDPALAAQLAKEIVVNDAADDELRAALLNTLEHLCPPDASEDGEFRARVAAIAGASTSAPLQRMARGYRDRHRP
ncbi:hypothetical protein [Sandaracinus amylolyticus]|uniref:HEAT repeat protein n=1 Tax=Sandaracinus amylolyticus TaxID=927083 RepID=A0A0F6W038_9BACT|nr:hypothetical protein [Sandaracinus amylolyticus]AKF04036.1 Hypothetical protein DB32_001185 [Sandaracinus amylolyticus]